MDLKNCNGFGLRNFYFTTVWKLFSKIFIRSGKMHYVGLNSGKVHSLSSGKGKMFLCAACHAFMPHVNAWKN